MIYSRYVTVVSRRGGRANSDPLRHAVYRSAAGAVGRRTTFEARCGAQVARVVDEAGFDSGHARACPRCRQALA